MSRTKLVLFAGTSSMALLLAGCEGGRLIPKPDGEASSSVERPAASRLVDQDIEAPEIFQKDEAGLWDGRPSLGGVWVAHPDVKDPERVVIRNEATGKDVIGALFRRERENPGPRLQVSSDAASALGLVAGAPTRLTVTALRREAPEEEVAPAAEQTEDPLPIAEEDLTADAAPLADGAEGTEGESAPVETAAAEIEPAPEAPKKKGLFGLFKRKDPVPEAPEEGVLQAPDVVETATLAPASEGSAIATATVEAIASTAIDTAAPATTTAAASEAAPVGETEIATLPTESEPPRKRGWGLFQRKEVIAAPASALRPDALAPAAALPDASLPDAGVASVPQADATSLADEVAVDPDLVDGPASLALSDEVKPRKPRWSLFKRKTPAADPASVLTQAALATESAEGPSTAPAPISGRSFVQIGVFSLKDQAESAAHTLRNGGVIPTLTQSKQNGTTYWSVLAGPSTSAADQTTLLRKVQGLGFVDATITN